MKRIDMAGKTFGYWTVQDSYIDENNRVKWLCVCRCGTVKYVDMKNLLFGKSQSCGCLPMELSKNRIKDLTGQEFGRLKVLRRAPENRHGRVSWICKCQCGNECIVTGHELQQGKTKSCGCLKKLPLKKVDLTDQTFGRLTARYDTGKRDRKGSVIWHCTCTCSGEIDVPQDRLVNQNTQSCGCLKREAAADLKDALHFVDGTCVEFLQRKQRCDNTSGHTGVNKRKGGTYSAVIGFKGKRYDLGIFDTYEEAVKVREYAEDVLHTAFVKQYHQRAEKAGLTGEKELPERDPSVPGPAGKAIERNRNNPE